MMGTNQDEAHGLAAKIQKKGESVAMNVKQAITNACLRVERDAKLAMKNTNTMAPGSRTPSGKLAGRSVGKTGKRHMPSLPYNAPAMDTGDFARKITHDVDENVGRVGTKDKRGPWLEYGTSKMAPRPWLGPALEKNMEAIKADFAASLKQPQIQVEQGPSE